MIDYQILPYASKYRSQCLGVFSQNVPAFFAANEQQDFEQFLTGANEGYKVVLDSNSVIGCFGITDLEPHDSARISWIMVSPNYHRKGAGKVMMINCLSAAHEHNLNHINISASHLSAPFFEHYGAKATNYIENGWGQNMHRIDMILPIN